MGNKKIKKKPKGIGDRKKTLPWLRDVLALIGGAVVGGLMVYIASAYLAGREAKEVRRIFADDIRKAIPSLNPMAERYLEATDGKRKDARDLLVGIDLSKPVHSLNLYKSSIEVLGSLDKACLVRLLDFYRNLNEAEFYRRLILEEQQRPNQTATLMQREFLRAVYESSLLTSPLLSDLNAGKGN